MLSPRAFAALMMLLFPVGLLGCPTDRGDDDDDSVSDDDDVTTDDDDATADDDDATADDDDVTGDDDDVTDPPLNWTTLYASGRDDAFLLTVDPATGAELTRVAITGPDPAPAGTVGLAWHPDQSTLFVVLKRESEVPEERRVLATLDPATGVATELGSLGVAATDLAFSDDGTLYTVSGFDFGDPNILYTVSLADGSTTMVATLLDEPVKSPDGEALAFNPNDGMLLRMSGNDPYALTSVDPVTGAETAITLSGLDERSEGTALAYDPNTGSFLFTDRDENLYGLDGAGAGTLIGSTGKDDTLKGLAWGP